MAVLWFGNAMTDFTSVGVTGSCAILVGGVDVGVEVTVTIVINSI